MKHGEWRMKAQWYARWIRFNPEWLRAELVTPHGFGTLDLYVRKIKDAKHILRLGFIWQGWEYQMRLENTKPISRLRAVRIANKWIRGIAERTER